MLDGEELSWEEGWAYIDKMFEEAKKRYSESAQNDSDN